MKHTGINNYWIDEYGNVTNKNTSKVIKQHFNKSNGYKSVCLSDKGKLHYRYIHRLVASCYHSLSEFVGADVNHKDGNKLNNHYLNLEWCTRSENIRHSFSLGLSNTKGERNSQAKLTIESVKKIKEYLKNGINRNEIAKRFNVNSDTIRHIQNGKNWSHI